MKKVLFLLMALMLCVSAFVCAAAPAATEATPQRKKRLSRPKRPSYRSPRARDGTVHRFCRSCCRAARRHHEGCHLRPACADCALRARPISRRSRFQWDARGAISRDGILQSARTRSALWRQGRAKRRNPVCQRRAGRHRRWRTEGYDRCGSRRVAAADGHPVCAHHRDHGNHGGCLHQTWRTAQHAGRGKGALRLLREGLCQNA